MPLELAKELWRLLGFPNQPDDAVPSSRPTSRRCGSPELVELGILGRGSQAALVRTWGAASPGWRSGRPACSPASPSRAPDPGRRSPTSGLPSVLPRVEALQDYVWRRHLASAAQPADWPATRRIRHRDAGGGLRRHRRLHLAQQGASTRPSSCDWLEHFEAEATGAGRRPRRRVIKTIGDEVLFVADDAGRRRGIALRLTARGADEDDLPGGAGRARPRTVVRRLGDVFGPTVNIASRLTSVARPGRCWSTAAPTRARSGRTPDEEGPPDDAGDAAYGFRRMRRTSVKGYAQAPGVGGAAALSRPRGTGRRRRGGPRET